MVDVEALSIIGEQTADGPLRLLLDKAWPKRIAIADGLFENYDERFMHVSEPYVVFVLSNGFARW